MIEYIKYNVKISEDNLFNELKDALCFKAEILQKIQEGEYDDILEENAMWGMIQDFPIKSREYSEAVVTLNKVFYTPSGIEKRRIRIYDNGKECQPSDSKITIELYNESYTVDLNRKDEIMYVPGGMICMIAPWACSGIPLVLDICICPDGGILHRGWDWSGNANQYLHTSDKKAEIRVTEEMINTVNGLFSGRILFEGLKIPVGGTVQGICPIDCEREEKRTGKKIYLA